MDRITERLARRVKGLMSDFCALLLINPAQAGRSGRLFAVSSRFHRADPSVQARARLCRVERQHAGSPLHIARLPAAAAAAISAASNTAARLAPIAAMP